MTEPREDLWSRIARALFVGQSSTMSVEYWLKGRVTLDAAGRKAAEAELDEEGFDDAVLSEEGFVWSGDELTVDERGSSSYSDFDNSSCVLAIYARHAKTGELFAINIEDGTGERYPAGSEEAIELDDAEVDALRAEYGWQSG